MTRLALSIVCLACLAGRAAAADPPKLKVSDDHRFLVIESGAPFFYLGDTAWELFHRLDREQATAYLEDRAEKGFTVVQAVVLAELDGLNDPNPYGQKPLVENDPTKPNEAYFEHVDFIVAKANELGLLVGMLPTWGDKWHDTRDGQPPIFNLKNAELYGEFLGKRYKDAGLIWILGGDRVVENDDQKAIIRAMAGGLREGDGGSHLITFHPRGGESSATWFHDEEWLDFNMNQNGHVVEYDRYANTRRVYDRTPVKPVIDGEPLYEDHPISFNAKERGHSTAFDVRRALYWDLFAGAFGHTYGHHSVWQMYAPGRNPINGPLMPWDAAIEQPGAAQMQHGRRLIESRPFLTRIPDDSLIVPEDVATSVPGAGDRRFAATRDEQGRFAMIYVPIGRRFTVDLDRLAGDDTRAWWYDPRTGDVAQIGVLPSSGKHEFEPPTLGEATDWVLVLDDASEDFPPPGQPLTDRD